MLGALRDTRHLGAGGGGIGGPEMRVWGSRALKRTPQA